jgi:hypothetical protein
MASFYSRALRGSNVAYTRREGGRQRLGAVAERACVHVVQSATRAAIAGAGVEATRRGFLSVRRWRGGELYRGVKQCHHTAHTGVPVYAA